MKITPLESPFDLDSLMIDLRERAFTGDELAIRAIGGIALLLLGFRNGDTVPSAEPAPQYPAPEEMN